MSSRYGGVNEAMRDALARVAHDPDLAQRQARGLAGRIATLMQASLVLRFSPAEVADAFVASRLAPRPAAEIGLVGAGAAGTATATIVERATPAQQSGG